MLSPHYPFVYSEPPEFVALECDTSPYRVVRYVPERTCRNDSIKRGKGVFVCSECGVYLDISDMDWDGEDDSGGFYEPSYCPECGAKCLGVSL